MTTIPTPTRDMLPTALSGSRSTGWWGMLMVIANEATLFASLIAAYFYVRFNSPAWPPTGIEPPELVLPLIMTVILVSSSVFVHLGQRRIERGDVSRLTAQSAHRLGASGGISSAASVRIQPDTLPPRRPHLRLAVLHHHRHSRSARFGRHHHERLFAASYSPRLRLGGATSGRRERGTLLAFRRCRLAVRAGVAVSVAASVRGESMTTTHSSNTRLALMFFTPPVAWGIQLLARLWAGGASLHSQYQSRFLRPDRSGGGGGAGSGRPVIHLRPRTHRRARSRICRRAPRICRSLRRPAGGRVLRPGRRDRRLRHFPQSLFADQHVAAMNLTWNWGGSELFLLELLVGFYALGALRRWLSSGHGIVRRQGWAFGGCLIALFVALISPLDRLSDVLFSAHMTQHMILILIAAPLFVLSDFPVALLWALPRRWAHRAAHGWQHGRALWRLLTQPPIAWVIYTVTLWVWHFPVLYEAALHNPIIHLLEHTAFFTTAALFWWVLFQPATRKPMQYGVNIIYLFITLLQCSALGALLTFSAQPWYGTYVATSTRLTPLGDQQIAGLIMWLPGGVFYVVLASSYFIAWMDALERTMPRRLADS